ncbi:flagellar hook-length control protein FliK [Pseudoduganella eburnea]|uniref:Flagellar hook-length control protein FliK n=2 Tax=Massilia eburnea TaxID=1776165 RepID=A0A6L6QFR7_9BURK|nr:flagellar hook-length control protein FliK [Massilia eburnea]
MLAMIQGYGQPAATDAAAAAAAASAAGKDSRATDATLAGDAVLDGKSGKTGIADRLATEGLPVDQAALLAAKASAEDAAKSKAAAGDQDATLSDALSKLGHGAATDATGSGKAAEPAADFKAALQQASADASKAADLAALESKHAAQPQASALQAAAAALAPAGAATAQAAQAVASNQLHARVGSQGWDQQLGQKVVWMVNGGEQSATLTLNPPDLGPLQVVLNVSNDQASVAFTAAQPEVRQALEQALPKLRETMGEAGITLGNTSVSSGSQEQQQAFAEMASGGRGRGVAGGQSGNGGEGEASIQPAPQVRRSVLSAVDTFA